MYILFFLLELINIYVVFNVALKSFTWFTTSVQVPTLNYLNNIVNGPTKYLLLPRLHIETHEYNTTEDDTSDDTTEDDTSDDTTEDNTSDDTEDDTTEDDATEDDTTEDDATEDDATEDDASEDDTTKDEKLEKSITPDSDSSDSEDEVKHLPVKPSVIIMDEKLD